MELSRSGTIVGVGGALYIPRRLDAKSSSDEENEENGGDSSDSGIPTMQA